MEIVELECANCGKKLYIQQEYIRKQLFCTPKCMDSFATKEDPMNSSIIRGKIPYLRSNLIYPKGS